jgi:hypothetical protein
MCYRLATTFAVLYALAFVAGAYFAADALSAPAPAPRAVSLSDARYAPDTLRYLHAGERTCARGFARGTDLSAYRWDGSALGPQRWNKDRTRMLWANRVGKRVVFDGVCFYNRTNGAVLVAAWEA